MNELTQRLSAGDHPVTMGGPEPSVAELRTRIEEFKHVSVKFTGTRGGTDLGVRLDMDATEVGNADFDAGTGTVHLEGTLTLNGDPVRCVADLDLPSLAGTGRLVPVDQPVAV